jgi:hypothetical protein
LLEAAKQKGFFLIRALIWLTTTGSDSSEESAYRECCTERIKPSQPKSSTALRDAYTTQCLTRGLLL